MATTAVSSTTSTATTSSTTSTTSASSASAASKAAAQKLVSSLSAGSGVDVNSLAQNLVDAERGPQQAAINAKITKNESRISGFAAVSYVLSQVQTALTDLKDQKNFNTLTVDNAAPNAFTVTANTQAVAASHDVDVLALAKAQRTVSSGFSSPTQSLNPSALGGKAITYALKIGSGASAVSTDIKLPDGQDTPQALVQAINDANKGVTAQLVNTGEATNPYHIVLMGEQGAAKQFTLTPSYSLGGVGAATDSLNNGTPISLKVTLNNGLPTTVTVPDTPGDIVTALTNLGLNASLVANPSSSTYANKLFVSGPAGSPSSFTVDADYGDGRGLQSLLAPVNVSFTDNQTATDAKIRVDGVEYTRSSNTLTDVLPGLTFNLKATTSTISNGVTTDHPVAIALNRDTSGLKTKMDAVVTAYNDAMTMFGAVSDPKSTLETYGATLVGDSTVRSLKSQLRTMIMGNSSTPGTNVGALWQMGFKVDEKGVMTLDSTKLDTALTNNFTDVVKTFTGNQNNLLTTSTQSGGVAGDAVRKLTTILGATGALVAQTSNAETQNNKYKTDLTKLQTRMDALLVRYQKQFAAMDSLVGNVNSQKTSLKSSFDGMMAMYTNK